MKRLSRVMLLLMLSSFVITFTSCETDTDDLTGPIDRNLPEITGISASKTTIPAGATIQLSVESNGDSYSWSTEGGDIGEFSAPSSNETEWTSSGLSTSALVKVVCTVTNSGGTRQASVTVTAVFLTEPTHHWSFDTDLTSQSNLTAEGSGVTITSDAKVGAGAALCAGDTSANIPILMDASGLPTNAEDNYTITCWIKTDVLGYAVFSRVDPVEFWNWEGYCKTWAIFNDYGYEMTFLIAGVWKPTVIEGAPPWWDGEWHHYAITHNESDNYSLYVDGEEFASDAPWYGETTSDDDGTAMAMGGGGWGTVLDGVLDEWTYYNQVLGAAEIALLADQ